VDLENKKKERRLVQTETQKMLDWNATTTTP
jgi:hypothetical protein